MVSERAKLLRRNQTDAEARLWFHLRRRQLDGFGFRRQHPIGPYIVDFACLAEKLIVELDGGQHAEQVTADEQRTKWLEGRGYRVIRFWNNDVLQNTDGVLQNILATLKPE
jgi:very-short-patch-repair endonuclease